MWARARFSRWGYLICPIRWVNLKCCVYAHNIHTLCVCMCTYGMMCISLRSVHMREVWCQLLSRGEGQTVCGSGWIQSFIVLGQIHSHQGADELQGEAPVYYPSIWPATKQMSHQGAHSMWASMQHWDSGRTNKEKWLIKDEWTYLYNHWNM